jgi:hypothetical protein
MDLDYCAKEEAIELFLTGYTRQVRNFSALPSTHLIPNAETPSIILDALERSLALD